ncbi:MAG: hypothetical protein GY765_18435 [bacterium]|nr:hypothetical protein [bacterium]
MYGNLETANLLGVEDILSTIRGKAANGENVYPSGESAFAASLKNAFSARELTENKPESLEAYIRPEGTSLSARLQGALLRAQLGATGDIAGTDDAVTTDPENEDPTGETGETVGDGTDTSVVDSVVKTTPTRSLREVIFATGDANADLLSQINNAITTDERLGYVTELRDKIVSALREEGYTTETTADLDKITIDGELYDVVRKYRTPGRIAKVQALHQEANPATFAGGGSGGGVEDAILKATEDGMNLLLQIRGSQSSSEQENLAAMIQDMVVTNLKEQGYEASALSSPDKITVNGTTYDFIRGLGSDGANTQFQVMEA